MSLQMINAGTFNNLLQRLSYDTEAKVQFFDNYYDIIKAHSFMNFPKCVDWEDIAHDVVRKLLETDWRGYEYVKFPSAWLRTIIINHAKDFFKHSSRIVSLGEMYDEKVDLGEDLIGSEIWERLKGFPPDVQYIITAHFRDGYSYLEIAKKLGLTHENVRVKAYRALKSLKISVFI